MVHALAGHVTDPDVRARLTVAATLAGERLAALADHLPRQAVHLDLTDANVISGFVNRLTIDGSQLLADDGLEVDARKLSQFAYLSVMGGAGDDTVVTLTRGYWLGRTEVTQAQWQAVAERMPVFQNVPLPSFFKGSDRPVEKISWLMAAAFCARLTERERAAGRLPDGYEYALPTEAQWEYACRAGTIGAYPGDLDAMTWYESNSGDQSHPVAQRQPNAWGLYDMTGNVNEWCADWYDGYPGGHASDPAGPVSGVYRVHRGGSWNSPAGACRSALRNCQLDWYTGKATGMRLALVPQRAPLPVVGSAGKAQ